jgi:hypothetical protein
MQTLVEHKTVNIQVRDVSGMCVCLRCKGAGTRVVGDYYNPYAMQHGGLVSAWHYAECYMCHGAGFWKESNAKVSGAGTASAGLPG